MKANVECGWYDPVSGGDSHPCEHASSDGIVTGLLADGKKYELMMKKGQWLVRDVLGVCIIENDEFEKKFKTTRYEKPNWCRNVD